MPQFRCSAILFDLDGVLVDSTPAIVEVWTAWSLENGIAPARTLETIHGRRTKEVLRILTPHLDIERVAHQIEHDITYREGGTIAIPGAAHLLNSLPRDRWCIVTSGMGQFARPRLQAAGLPVPEVLVSADDVANGKPHPEPYLQGAGLLGVAPQKCLVIEDAINGIRAGHAGGMKAIGLTTTYAAEELREADAVAKSLEGVSVVCETDELTVSV
jgi:mannitol-1-/sugar-/sorbitol-6-phosphatase